MFTTTPLVPEPDFSLDPPAPSAVYPSWFPALSLFFALPRLPTVRDFFLSESLPAIFLDTLCSPPSLDAAWSSTVDFEPYSSTTASTTPATKQADVIFIPSQCTATLTLGTVIISKPLGNIKVGRFVRDDSDGTLFIVMVSSVVDVYSIVHHGSMRVQKSHLRYKSFTDYTHAFMDFQYEYMNQPIPEKVESYFQSRPCYMCQSTDDLKACNCRLSFISPSRPADFSPFRANMQAFAGAFMGVSYLATPASILPEEIGYRSTIAPLANPSMFSSIIQLAIQVLLSSTQPLSTTPTIDNNTTAATQPLMFEPIAFSDISNTSAPCSPMDELPHPFSLNDILANQEASPPSAFQESVEGILKFPARTAVELTKIKKMPERTKTAKSKTTTSRSKGIKKKKRELTEKELAEREARRELRIAKNRQAAARSNLRRKQQNDSLKAALAAARNQALQLRDRHLKLREENLTLKMALFAPATSASPERSSAPPLKMERTTVEC